ncbi:MAG: HAD family phosphatase, partial [Lachnospiraceae bacterium]|nr:HAD family phosphatase [Lachnospiraceae bacterium]
MFKDTEAFIFDMDGTLVDSMGIWKEIDIEYLSSKSIPFPEDLQQNLEGMCFHDTARYFKKRFNIEDPCDVIEKTWNDMAEYKYTHEVDLKQGVLDVLSYAKDKGIKLGIATSNSRRLTDALLKAKG